MLEMVSFHTGFIFEANILVIVGLGFDLLFGLIRMFGLQLRFIFYGVAILLIWRGRLFFSSLV